MPHLRKSHAPAGSRSLSELILSSGWLWGLGLTVAFYAGLPYLPAWREEAQRYFCAHWI